MATMVEPLGDWRRTRERDSEKQPSFHSALSLRRAHFSSPCRSCLRSLPGLFFRSHSSAAYSVAMALFESFLLSPLKGQLSRQRRATSAQSEVLECCAHIRCSVTVRVCDPVLCDAAAKVLNLLCLLCTFLAFVGCCVGFAGGLFTVSFPAGDGTAHWTFFQSYLQTEANRIEYSGAQCNGDVESLCNSCKNGGRGFLATQVIAFIVLLGLLACTTLRVAGGVAIHALAHPAHSLLLESWSALLACLAYFLGVVVWGSSCYKSAQATDDWTVHMTGFAFTILCFFFLFIELLLLWAIRKDHALHLGYQSSAFGHAGMNEQFVDGQDEQEAREREEEAQSREAQRRQIEAQRRASQEDDYTSGYQSSSDQVVTKPPPAGSFATQGERVQY